MDHVSAGQKTPSDLSSETPGGPESGHAKRQIEELDPMGATAASDGGEHGCEEGERQRIERLGRERPEKLKSLIAEILFCYSIIASQFMAVSNSGAEGLTIIYMKY